VDSGALAEPTDKATRDAYAERGFVHVPSSAQPGGIVAVGGIRRDATLSLAGLRLLAAGSDDSRTLLLRRYVLGLSLVAFTARPSSHLRQGCLLVLDPSKPREFVEVYGDGRRVPASLTHDEALAYAKAAAGAFGVGLDRCVKFDADRAGKDMRGEGKAKKGRKAKAGAVAEEA
jgi:CRISPR-associated protein Csb1